MQVSGIVVNIPVSDIDESREFYADYLGLSVEAFNLGWVAHLQSPDGSTHIQLVTKDATAPQDANISIHVGAGIDGAFIEAQRRGYEIIYPLTTESWGLRRFFVRAPDGTVVNVTSHPA